MCVSCTNVVCPTLCIVDVGLLIFFYGTVSVLSISNDKEKVVNRV